MVAHGEVPGGSQRGRGQIVGDGLRLKHGQIVLRLQSDDRGVGFQPVGEYHFHPHGSGHHVEVGENDPLVDDDDPGSDALFDLIVSVRVGVQPPHAHHRGPDDLVRLRCRRRQGFGLQRAQHGRVNVLLGKGTQ